MSSTDSRTQLRQENETVLTEAHLKAAVPDFTRPYNFLGLKGRAVIRRDRWGIPHIKAEHEYDLFFAQGFATAQDRLFQMDFDRLRGLGRAAEYLGAQAIQQDKYVRRRRLEQVSKRDYAMASEATRSVLLAYTHGVNAFIQSARVLPIEYTLLGTKPELWEPWHCIAVYKVRNTAEGSFQGKLWLSKLASEVGPIRAAALSPGCQSGSLLTVQPGERYVGPLLNAIDELRHIVNTSSTLHHTEGGSNGWAVCGDRTASGQPMVAGDSHRGLEVPNVYYQVHLIGNDFAVTGFSLPGFPMALHFCHNEHVSWGMTHAGIDTQDLFVEKCRDLNGRIEYLVEDEWFLANRAQVEIKVRGGDPEQVEIFETHHGPVIAGDPRSGAAITLADPGSAEGTRWVDAAYRAMKARSADEFEAALENWTDRANNYVYADVNGNYGYTLRGRIPIRNRSNGWGPVAGWNGAHEWKGYISPAELPRVRNPPIGWVVTCNQRVVDESYPYYLTNFCSAPYRAERIVSRLDSLSERSRQLGNKITVEDMSAIHGDVTCIPAQMMQRALVHVFGSRIGGIAKAEALLRWDAALSADSFAAALYEMTAVRLSELLSAGLYGRRADDCLKGLDAGAEEHWRRQLRPALITALEVGDASVLPPGETWESLLSNSLEWAAARLEERLGADEKKWRWGALHESHQQHVLATIFPEVAVLLNPPRVELPGDSDTPFASSFRMGANFDASAGPVNRYIHDPSNWVNSRWIVPLGASGHPGSAHYADQQKMWAKVETIPQLWNWEQIGREAESEQELRKLQG